MRQDVKDAMVRLAAAQGTAVADRDRRIAGRGGYLHPRKNCVDRFVNSKLREFRSLGMKLDRGQRLRIAETIAGRLDSEVSVE